MSGQFTSIGKVTVKDGGNFKCNPISSGGGQSSLSVAGIVVNGNGRADVGQTVVGGGTSTAKYGKLETTSENAVINVHNVHRANGANNVSETNYDDIVATGGGTITICNVMNAR